MFLAPTTLSHDVSPQPQLLSVAKTVEPGSQIAFAASAESGQDEWFSVAAAAGAMHAASVDVKWDVFFDDSACAHVRLPTYAWQMEKFWVEPMDDRVPPLPAWHYANKLVAAAACEEK